jgi:hypothetical protein
VPAHLRALAVILVLAIATFILARAPITAHACSQEDFTRRRNVWFGLTLACFLSHNFWVFIVVSMVILAYAMRTEWNRFALYLSSMLTLPHLSLQLPGFGVFDQLFTVSQLRMLALALLLPTYLSLRKSPDVVPFGRLLADKLVLAGILLKLVLTVPHTSLTNLVREGVLYPFLDLFLLYYVASRSLKTLQMYRDALSAFVVGAMVYSVVIAFEFMNHWLLYRGLDAALNAQSHAGQNYLLRAGLLRAEGTGGQSIVSGLTCAVAIGFYLYVAKQVRSPVWRALGMLSLVAGIIGAFARGPWVGATMMVVLFMLLGPSPFKSVAKLVGVGALILPFVLMTESGSKVLDFLPWVGTVDAKSVTERNTLAAVTLQLINQNPLFGHFDFEANPHLERLRGGDGLIDIVNTYAFIALGGGYVSLLLFLGPAIVAILGILKSLFVLDDKAGELHALGRALIVTLLGMLFMIGAVSPILSVYPIYWCIVGLSIGYCGLVARSGQSTRNVVTRRTSAFWSPKMN